MKLYDRLKSYAYSDAYPMHMPGHKRNTQLSSFEDPYAFDITEINGFDNLHEPEGILLEKLQEASRFYGSDRTFYLVNGSTCGILTGISAAVKRGDHVLIARNSHRSVYNALIAKGLNPLYLNPQCDQKTGIAGSIPPSLVKEKLQENSDRIRLVVITSPTYEGVVSDIASIAEICHAYGVPLLVDEAHGAHFRCQKKEEEIFPCSALTYGADIVVQSLHKTMPSLTQTALLHIRGNLVDPEEVKFYLDLYQTSSPSYILMASMDHAITLRQSRQWNDVLNQWNHHIALYRSVLKELRVLEGFEPEDCDFCFGKDPSKFVISTANTHYSGQQLMQMMRAEYGIEMEMASSRYVIAMTGAGDRTEGIVRFCRAIKEIDERWAREESKEQPMTSYASFEPRPVLMPAKAHKLRKNPEAWEVVKADASACGRICADFLYVYPPGIPLAVPGEAISESMLAVLRQQSDASLTVHGLVQKEYEGIRVFKKEFCAEERK